MRIIDPKGYGELEVADRDAVDAWLEFNGIEPRDVGMISLIADGSAFVTHVLRDENGVAVPSPFGGFEQFKASLPTQPELGGHDE